MPSDLTAAGTVQVNEVEGKVFVDVPWARAEFYQDHFKREGIGSTLHLDPAARTARLELLTNLSAARVAELLAACKV